MGKEVKRGTGRRAGAGGESVNSRDKGKRGERELAAILKEHGMRNVAEKYN